LEDFNRHSPGDRQMFAPEQKSGPDIQRLFVVRT